MSSLSLPRQLHILFGSLSAGSMLATAALTFYLEANVTSNICPRGLAVAAAVLDVLSATAFSLLTVLSCMERSLTQSKIASVARPTVTLICLLVSTLAIGLTIAMLILIHTQVLNQQITAFNRNLKFVYADFGVLGLFVASALAYSVVALYSRNEVLSDADAQSMTRGQPQELGNITSSSTRSTSLKVPGTHERRSSPPSSSGSTLGKSVDSATYHNYTIPHPLLPQDSKTHLLRRERDSSVRETQSTYSGSERSPRASWDTWDVATPENNVQSTSTYTREGLSSRVAPLETIPGSRPLTPSNALDTDPALLSPSPPPPSPSPPPSPTPRRPTILTTVSLPSPVSAPRSAPTTPASPVSPNEPFPRTLRSATVSHHSYASLRPGSAASFYNTPSDESHIHPLFRTESPIPPPTATPGTIITASPLGGQLLSHENASTVSLRPYSSLGRKTSMEGRSASRAGESRAVTLSRAGSRTDEGGPTNGLRSAYMHSSRAMSPPLTMRRAVSFEHDAQLLQNRGGSSPRSPGLQTGFGATETPSSPVSALDSEPATEANTADLVDHDAKQKDGDRPRAPTPLMPEEFGLGFGNRKSRSKPDAI